MVEVADTNNGDDEAEDRPNAPNAGIAAAGSGPRDDDDRGAGILPNAEVPGLLR